MKELTLTLTVCSLNPSARAIPEQRQVLNKPPAMTYPMIIIQHLHADREASALFYHYQRASSQHYLTSASHTSLTHSSFSSSLANWRVNIVPFKQLPGVPFFFRTSRTAFHWLSLPLCKHHPIHSRFSHTRSPRRRQRWARGSVPTSIAAQIKKR